MRERVGTWALRTAALLAGSVVWGAGCSRDLQRELEVLFRAGASPGLLYDSSLIEAFGPAILRLFN